MPSLSDVMWSSLLFDDSIHRYKLVSLAGKEWEKEQRGERKMERQDRSDIIAAPHLLQSVVEPRVEGKQDVEGRFCSPPPTLIYVERITNHYSHLSSPHGPSNTPLLMKLHCKIAEYKCFVQIRQLQDFVSFIDDLPIHGPTRKFAPSPWLCKETLWLKKERGKEVKDTLLSTNPKTLTLFLTLCSFFFNSSPKSWKSRNK